jgi:hypothetical protein
MTRWRAAAGVLAPSVFIAAWAVLGARTDGYSPVDDPISRLAAVGAPTRIPMTTALVAYAVGLGVYAGQLRDDLSRPVAVAATLNVIGTIGIAATPLDSALGGVPHAAAAGLSYISLGALPALAAVPLARQGHRRSARLSAVAGACTLAALAMSAFGPDRTGLWQRTGLTLGDAWLIGSALWLLGRRPGPRAASVG